MRISRNWTLGLCMSAALLGSAGRAMAQSGNPPAITKITFTFNSGSTSPSQMDIYGAGFGTVKPSVTVDGLLPAVIQFTDQRVTVDFGSAILAPGTYLVTLTPNSKSSAGDDSKKTATFAATVGMSPASFLAGRACAPNTFLIGFDGSGGLVCQPAAAPAPASNPSPAPPPSPGPAPAPAPGPDPGH